MAAGDVIELEQLLAPIPGGNPAGDDLRWDGLYDRIKEARIEGNRDLLEGGEDKVADWSLIIDVATVALRDRTKDLMLAGWLTEALMVRHGFAGLRDGLSLVQGLLERYWDEVYPQPDDGDLEPRVAPIVWLLDPDRGARLPNRMRDIPLLAGEEGNYSWSYWKSRYCPPRGKDETDSSYELRQEQAAERERTFEAAARAASTQSVVQLHHELQQVRTAFQQLDQLLTQRFGALAPGVTGFRGALDEIGSLVRRLVKDKGGLVEAGGSADGEGAEMTVSGGGTPKEISSQAAAVGPIQTRDDAFRRLAEVAEYLRRTEPQSPIPLLIDRAIHWGKMPFHKLLREIVRDSSARDQVRDLLGINGEEDSSSN